MFNNICDIPACTAEYKSPTAPPGRPGTGAASLRSLAARLPRVPWRVSRHPTPSHPHRFKKNGQFRFPPKPLGHQVYEAQPSPITFPCREKAASAPLCPARPGGQGAGATLPSDSPPARASPPVLGSFQARVVWDSPAAMAEKVGGMQRCGGQRSSGRATWPHLSGEHPSLHQSRTQGPGHPIGAQPRKPGNGQNPGGLAVPGAWLLPRPLPTVGQPETNKALTDMLPRK